MKTKTFAWLAGLALATPTQAGTPSTETPPTPEVGIWEWFAGGSVGYLTDVEEEMYSLHLGMEYMRPGDRSHAIYLQVGFTQNDESFHYRPLPGITGGRTESAEIDVDLIPITLNYKYQASLTERFNYHLGFGVGLAILDSSYDWSWTQALPPPNNQGGGSDDETDVRFYGEVFAGLGYEISESLEVFTAVRYIFMDAVDLDVDVTGASDYEAGINDDVLIELGMRYHF